MWLLPMRWSVLVLLANHFLIISNEISCSQTINECWDEISAVEMDLTMRKGLHIEVFGLNVPTEWTVLYQSLDI